MFILRKIEHSTGVERNFELGDSYSLITRFKNPEEFEKICQKEYGGDEPIVFAFVQV
jgi:hypothetical protein